MTGSRLLLVNHFSTDYELQILWPRGPRQPTTPIRVPVNGVVDILRFIALPKDQARAVVENSPDYMKARSKFRVDIVDEENPPEAPVRLPPVVALKNGIRFLPQPVVSSMNAPPVGDDSGPVDWPDALPLPSKPGTTAEDGQRMAEEERRATEAFAEALRRSRGESKDSSENASPGNVNSSPESETKEPEPAGGLEPGMRELLADTLPSSRWPLEKLVEYASSRGIETGGLSKNALLRKIRNA